MVMKKLELIDRDRLVEVLSENGCNTEKVCDIIFSQPVVATATPRFEIEMMIC